MQKFSVRCKVCPSLRFPVPSPLGFLSDVCFLLSLGGRNEAFRHRRVPSARVPALPALLLSPARAFHSAGLRGAGQRCRARPSPGRCHRQPRRRPSVLPKTCLDLRPPRRRAPLPQIPRGGKSVTHRGSFCIVFLLLIKPVLFSLFSNFRPFSCIFLTPILYACGGTRSLCSNQLKN